MQEPRADQQLQDNSKTRTQLSTQTILASLSLHCHDISVEAARSYSIANFKMLRIFRSNINLEAAKLLTTSTSITSLVLASTKLGDKCAHLFLDTSNIRTLDVSNNGIGPSGAKSIASNSTLTELNLSHNKVGDEGAKYLSKNSTLTMLSLRNNEISDQGAEDLSQNLSLNTLGLKQNLINDRGIKAFEATTTLTQLDLEATSLRSDSNLFNDVQQRVYQNQRQQKERRTNFMHFFIALPHATANTTQTSFLILPKDVVFCILNFLKYGDIGKNVEQNTGFVQFVFSNANMLLSRVKERKPIKVIENSQLSPAFSCK